MMQHRSGVSFLLLMVVCCYSALLHLAPVDAQRFEFKHSFKRPFYLGRGGTIPFWEYGGSTVVSEDFVRLTPAMQSRVGWLWNTLPLEITSWEVLAEFEIGGGGKRGADGLAIWYAAEPKQEGTIFGSKNKWQGLGIFFDTFDNDSMNDNPKVLVMLNDGTIEYDPFSDGAGAATGSCSHDFRDKPTKVKINYKSGVLQLLIESFNSWIVCATIQADLPAGYFFGISAATGELTDNHDVYSFTTYNLEPLQKMASRLQPLRPPAEEKQEPVAATPVPVEASKPPIEPQKEAAPVHEQPVHHPVPPQPVPQQVVANVDLSQVLERLRQVSDEQRKINDAIRRLEGEIARRPAGGQDGMMAEAFEKLLNAVADIKETSGRRLEQITASLADVRNQMQREREAFNKEVFQQIHGIKQAVASVHAGVETAKNEQRNLQENLETNKQEIATKIERSTSFSMWFYILFFQACFAAVFVWWRKTTNEQKKWV